MENLRAGGRHRRPGRQDLSRPLHRNSLFETILNGEASDPQFVSTPTDGNQFLGDLDDQIEGDHLKLVPALFPVRKSDVSASLPCAQNEK